MLKQYSQCYGGQSALCYLPSPQRLIPSNQAIKDLDQRCCGYSNLGKIVIEYVAVCGSPLSATVDALITIPSP